MTWLDLFESILRTFGSLQQGETPSAEEAQDGLVVTNLFLKSLNSERASIYSLTDRGFAFGVGEQVKTIGPGATNFDQPRPVLVQNAVWVPSSFAIRGGLDLLNATQWNAIEDRTSTGLMVKRLYYDYLFPVANLNIHPIPTVAGQLFLTYWNQLTEIPLPDTELSFPDQYFEVLHTGLVVRLAETYGLNVTPNQQNLYVEAKQRMQVFNMQYIESRISAETGNIPAVGIPQRPPLVPSQPVVPAPGQ